MFKKWPTQEEHRSDPSKEGSEDPFILFILFTLMSRSFYIVYIIYSNV